MLSSIHPLGERAKGNSYRVTAAAFVVAAIAGGALVGAATGLVGVVITDQISPDTATLGIVVAAISAAAADWRGIRVPTLHRQVDERWVQEFRGWVYGAGYGVQLGAGVVTIISTWAIPLALFCAALTGDPRGGLVIGATFGAVRGASLLTGRRITTPGELVRFHDRLALAAPRTRSLPVAIVVVAALAVGLA